MLIELIAAHCIADFALQSEWMANNKGKYWYVMLVHSVIWAAAIYLTLDHLANPHILIFPFLLATHFLIDKWKMILFDPKNPEQKNLTLLYIDQTAHATTIFISACLSVF